MLGFSEAEEIARMVACMEKSSISKTVETQD